MTGRFRFRRFRTRLLVLVVGLLASTALASYIILSRVNRQNALITIEEALDQGVRQLRINATRREEDLLLAAGVMARDYAMIQLFLTEEFSPPTARSALASYRARIGAPILVLLSTDAELLAGTQEEISDQDLSPFISLVRTAEQAPTQRATGYGYFHDKLHQMVIVPLLAPDVVAWVGIGFPVDIATAQELKASAGLEISFLSFTGTARVLTSTLPSDHATELLVAEHGAGTVRTTLQGEDYVTRIVPLPLADGANVTVVLQRSLERELAPSRKLERTMAAVSIAGLLAALVAGTWVARNLSRPVQALAQHTRKISAGDYTSRIELNREDELGQLASAVNQMSTGLEERDQARDLLGKVVSPEIATQLLQTGVTLGGEEREVTIMFCDLRDFTSLSEKLPPAEVLALLNRYLDRMSQIIERHGGVIDKFIGDAIMALFGAPLAMPDAPIRAVAAAREMADSLQEMNRELRREGRPDLAFGIGINTARVVAGNMGSHTRLNYTVIGDGVNLAARLESLTKDPVHNSSVIISESTARYAGEANTLRALGDVRVKGKSEPIRIFSVDLSPRPWEERLTDSDASFPS